MAVQTTEEFKNGGATSYSITIEYLKESDIKVRIGGALQTYVASSPSSGEYTVSGTTVTLGATATAGTGNVHIYRETDVDTAAAVFAAGSSIKAADLNAIHDMARMGVAEARSQTITADVRDEQITTAKIAPDNITNALIADDQIDSEHYVDGSIDTQHIANENITTAKIATGNVTEAKIADLNVTTGKIADSAITTAKIADLNVTSGKIADGAITDAKIAGGSLDNRYYTETELDAGQLDNRYYTETELDNGQLDNRYYTETESDARYFNISTGDTIKDGDIFPDNDTTIATTAAINDRIIDLVEEVGGFVPIASETNFPTANPDINNGPGTLVSIKSIGTTRTPSGGVVTITNGAGTGNNVTITGCGTTVLSAGFGVIVETTAVLHTYAFHRLTPKATEITTVAGISTDVTTVSGIASDVTTVANIDSDVSTVAGNNANVTTVANNDANITAVKNNESNINSAVSNATNITTVAGSISNVNTAATNISSINNAAANITTVNKFGDTYQVASSNPSTDGGGNTLAEGDLYFNTSANRLKVYDGTNWVDGVQTSGGGAQTTGATFTGDLKLNDNVKLFIGTGDDLEVLHSGNNSIINERGTGDLLIQSSGNTKLTVTSSGITVTGNITVSGTVDGRDVAADGNKLDTISTAAISEILTGDVDVKTRKITTTTSNGNVQIEPNGSGVVEIRGASGNDGKLRLNCAAQSHGVVIASPNHSSGQSYTLILPDNNVSADKYLKVKSTTGSGSTATGKLEYAGLDANDLTEGTIPDARFPSTLPAISGENLTGMAAAEVYGFKTTNNNLIITTTNKGADNISGTDFSAFEDVLFAASGFSWSLNTDGKLIATI
jgi:hypothetical protein